MRHPISDPAGEGARAAPEAHLRVRGLTMAFGSFVLQRDLDFVVRRGDIFVVMGGSGCGKSTLLRHMVGLLRPAAGTIEYDGKDYWGGDDASRDDLRRGFGILYQSGALWSSMTLAENIMVPLADLRQLSDAERREIASLKLALVGLSGFEDFYPSQISGGMRKRAGLARAMALDPDILFFDEPSAGLDPISAKLLDDLILEIRESLGSTIVVVTHELASIFAIGTNSVFLDADAKTMLGTGSPKELLEDPPHPVIRRFLTRGEEGGARPSR